MPICERCSTATPTEQRLRQSSTPSSPGRRATRSSPRSCSQPADSGEALPRGVRDLLLRRFTQLDRSTRDVLRLVATAGDEVGYPLLRSLAGLPDGDLHESLRARRGPRRARRRRAQLQVPPPVARRGRVRHRPARRAGAAPRPARRGARACRHRRTGGAGHPLGCRRSPRRRARRIGRGRLPRRGGVRPRRGTRPRGAGARAVGPRAERGRPRTRRPRWALRMGRRARQQHRRRPTSGRARRAGDRRGCRRPTPGRAPVRPSRPLPPRERPHRRRAGGVPADGGARPVTPAVGRAGRGPRRPRPGTRAVLAVRALTGHVRAGTGDGACSRRPGHRGPCPRRARQRPRLPRPRRGGAQMRCARRETWPKRWRALRTCSSPTSRSPTC